MTGSRRNLSICLALVLMDMSNTFCENSTTSPPRMLESIWQKQTNISDNITKPVHYQIPHQLYKYTSAYTYISMNISYPIIKALRIERKATFCSSLTFFPCPSISCRVSLSSFSSSAGRGWRKNPQKKWVRKELSPTSITICNQECLH